MTWGQLRLLLQTELVTPTLDLIDGWLNARYEQVLESIDWLGKTYNATLTTTAAYQSGSDTVTLTVGNANVTGVSTSWTSGATVGMKFYRPGDSVIYTVTVWNSATSITLDRPYEGNGVDASGTVYTASSYVFMQNVYTLPTDCDAVVTLLDPVTGFPLTPFSKTELDESAGPRTLVQDPTSWAPYSDSNEGAPPVTRQIELFPPPLHARGIPLKYLHIASGFDGSNTSGGPLPFVSMSVLLSGVKADGYGYLAGKAESGTDKSVFLKLAMMHKAEFEQELARIIRVEHQQRRQPGKIRPAQRLTRHRLARAGRGLNNYWGPGQGGPN